MKKALIIGILGSGVTALSSFGQATFFGNYSNSSTDIGNPVTYSGVGTGLASKAGVAVGSDFSAELLYLVGSSYVAIPSSIEPFGSGATVSSPVVADGNTAKGAGYTLSNGVSIPGAAAGATVSLEWEAFNNVIIAGDAIGTITGISTPFTELLSSAFATGYNDFQPLGTAEPLANGGAEGGATGFNSFQVSGPIIGTPEPTTVALLGLGAAGLLGLRRRKA